MQKKKKKKRGTPRGTPTYRPMSKSNASTSTHKSKSGKRNSVPDINMAS